MPLEPISRRTPLANHSSDRPDSSPKPPLIPPPVPEPSKANPFEELSRSSDSSSHSKAKSKPGSRHGSGSATGLASKITGKAKLASQLAAKQAELTKLQNVTLMSAYHKLGKWVYNSKSGAEALADQFASVKQINSKIAQIKSAEPEKAEGLKAKAKQVAKAGADAAQIKLLQGKLQKAVYQLGKAAFVTKGLQIPNKLSAQIQQAQAKITTLKAETEELSEKLGTSGWNFKWVYGGAVVGLLVAGWLVMGAFSGIAHTVSDSTVVDREDIDDVMQSSKQAASSKQMPTVDFSDVDYTYDFSDIDYSVPEVDYTKGPNGEELELVEYHDGATGNEITDAALPWVSVQGFDGKSGGVTHGFHRIYLPDKETLVSESFLYDGALHGWSRIYYRDGSNQVKEEVSYRDDEKTGLLRFYSPTGRKEEEVQVAKGKKHGKRVVWHSNGEVSESDVWVENQRHGKRSVFFEHGVQKVELHYLFGTLHGYERMWHQNGQLALEVAWVHDKRVGPYTEWHENGQISKRGLMQDGEESGVWIGWHENGEVSYESSLRDGAKQGKELGWSLFFRIVHDLLRSHQNALAHRVPTHQVF